MCRPLRRKYCKRLLLRLCEGWATYPESRTGPSLLSTQIRLSASSRPKKRAIRSSSPSAAESSNTCRSLCRRVKWTCGAARAMRVNASLTWPNSVCVVRRNFRRTGVL